MGNAYMRACLKQHPCQTEEVRNEVNLISICVREDTERVEATGKRQLIEPIDFYREKVNTNAEELDALLAAFDLISDLVDEMTSAQASPALLELLVDKQALEQYKVPLSQRRIDDDLAVEDGEEESPLD